MKGSEGMPGSSESTSREQGQFIGHILLVFGLCAMLYTCAVGSGSYRREQAQKYRDLMTETCATAVDRASCEAPFRASDRYHPASED